MHGERSQNRAWLNPIPNCRFKRCRLSRARPVRPPPVVVGDDAPCIMVVVGKYDPLVEHLYRADDGPVEMTFAEIWPSCRWTSCVRGEVAGLVGKRNSGLQTCPGLMRGSARVVKSNLSIAPESGCASQQQSGDAGPRDGPVGHLEHLSAFMVLGRRLSRSPGDQGDDRDSLRS